MSGCALTTILILRLRSGQALRLRSGQVLRLRSGQALRLRSGQALRLRSGQVLRLRSGQVLRLRSGQALRLRSGQVLRLRSGQVLRLRSGQALRLRSGQALRLRSGQALRLRSGQVLRLRSGQALRLRSGQVLRLRSGQVLRLRSGQALRLRSGQALRLRSGRGGDALPAIGGLGGRCLTRSQAEVIIHAIHRKRELRRSPAMKDQLLSKIHNRTAVVAVVGLGYVGLLLAVAFAEKGFPVVGIDVDGGKVAAWQGGCADSRRVVCAGYCVGAVGRDQVADRKGRFSAKVARANV